MLLINIFFIFSGGINSFVISTGVMQQIYIIDFKKGCFVFLFSPECWYLGFCLIKMIKVTIKKQFLSQISFLSTVKSNWSQVISFDFNQLRNFKLSPFFVTRTLQTNCFNFSLVCQGLRMELACFLSELGFSSKKANRAGGRQKYEAPKGIEEIAYGMSSG